MTQRLCKICGDWHPLDDWPAACVPPGRPAPAFPIPMINTDTLRTPLQSMATGNWHTSKAAMRREYRDHGFVEIGNEKTRPKQAKIDSQAEAVAALKKHGLIG